MEPPAKSGCIIVNVQDFLIVLNRLLKLKLVKEQSKLSDSQSITAAHGLNKQYPNQQSSDKPEDLFSEEFLYSHYLQSLLKREEFKIAIELFGYRQEEITPEISQQSLSILRHALEGILHIII
jgi:hypothetical protein